MIFGPTTLHGDAIKMKCEQMGFTNYYDYLEVIKEKIHSIITEKSFITETELEDLIKNIIQ